MRQRLIVLCLVPAVLALAACGSSKSTSSSTSTPAAAPAATPTTTTASSGSAAGSSTTVSESEFQLTPKNASIKAGKVTITIKNTGQVTLARALEGAGPGGKDLKSSAVNPGQTTTLTATLKAGKIEWYCPIDGHKSMGMVGHLTVTG
jgi:uncharacterized cupredoxin-like copper-binding protein